MLPSTDQGFLAERAITHEMRVEAGMTCVVLPGWSLPAGYDRQSVDLLVRLPAGYPDLPPDMWWFDPPVRLATGATVPATEATEQHLGRTWQRWSRHFQPGQWKSGIDGLESFTALIREELTRCAKGGRH
jgi:hypothetical protein